MKVNNIVYNHRVTTKTHVSELREIAASQWGMFTIPQAAAIGVQRQQVFRLTQNGNVERVSAGVYRFLAGGETTFSEIKAAWMSIFPQENAYNRLVKQLPDAVVTGTTAAYLYGVGDLYSTPYTFWLAQRKQTSRRDMQYHIGSIPSQDIAMNFEIPCVKPARMIADLVRFSQDMSLIEDTVADCTQQRILDNSRLVELLAPLAFRNGYRKNDGKTFAEELLGTRQNLAP